MVTKWIDRPSERPLADRPGFGRGGAGTRQAIDRCGSRPLMRDADRPGSTSSHRSPGAVARMAIMRDADRPGSTSSPHRSSLSARFHGYRLSLRRRRQNRVRPWSDVTRTPPLADLTECGLCTGVIRAMMANVALFSATNRLFAARSAIDLSTVRRYNDTSLSVGRRCAHLHFLRAVLAWAAPRSGGWRR